MLAWGAMFWGDSGMGGMHVSCGEDVKIGGGAESGLWWVD